MRHLNISKEVHQWALDKALLVGWSISLILLTIAAFWISESYGHSPLLVFGAIFSLGFAATIGWSFRRYRRSLGIIIFLFCWLVVHIALTLTLLSLSPSWWLPALFIEAFIGYGAAFLLFGIAPK